jgi:hypothetical protein
VLHVRLGRAEEVRRRRAVHERLEHRLRLGAEEQDAVVAHVLRLVPFGADHPDPVAAGGVDVARAHAEHLVGPGSREQLNPHDGGDRASHVRQRLLDHLQRHGLDDPPRPRIAAPGLERIYRQQFDPHARGDDLLRRRPLEEPAESPHLRVGVGNAPAAPAALLVVADHLVAEPLQTPGPERRRRCRAVGASEQADESLEVPLLVLVELRRSHPPEAGAQLGDGDAAHAVRPRVAARPAAVDFSKPGSIRRRPLASHSATTRWYSSRLSVEPYSPRQ